MWLSQILYSFEAGRVCPERDAFCRKEILSIRISQTKKPTQWDCSGLVGASGERLIQSLAKPKTSPFGQPAAVQNALRFVEQEFFRSE